MNSLGLLIIISLLQGCAIYNTEFECKAKSGVGCKSMSKVHQMVEKGELKEDEEEGVFKPVKKSHDEKKKELKIWFAEFSDKKGKLHQEKFIKYNNEASK